MAGIKFISITPEPKWDAGTAFITALPQAISPELLDVCETLGISPSELQPKSLSDVETSASRVGIDTHLRHYEELRKAKLAVVQKELCRRKLFAQENAATKRVVSPPAKSPDLPPVLPMSAVALLNHRLDYVSSRIDTTRRVNENQAKLLLQQHSTHGDLLRSLSEKQKRSEEQRRNKDIAAKERAEALRKHREEILRKIKSLQERHEIEEIMKERRGKTPKPQPVSSHPPTPFVRHSSVDSLVESSYGSEEDDFSQEKLQKIAEKLAKSSHLAESRKNATRQMLRKKLEMVEVIRENKHKREAEEESQRIKEIEKLKCSTDKHIKNREVRISETVQRLEEERKKKEEKTKRELMRRNHQNRSLEKAYQEREAMRMQQIERHTQSRQQNSIEKALRSDQRHELVEEYRELIHDLQVNERERMIMKWRKAEQSLSEIREVKDRVRSFHEKATMQLKEEKERRLRSISRGKRVSGNPLPVS